MSNHKPLLTDNVIYGRRNKSGRRVPMAGFEVRDYYESLIAQGRLRVVEEVSLDEHHHCNRCRTSNAYEDHMSGTMEDNLNDYCRGCGNPIKRDA